MNRTLRVTHCLLDAYVRAGGYTQRVMDDDVSYGLGR
jgi:hypothetical protein